MSYFQICVVANSVQAIFHPAKNAAQKRLEAAVQNICEKIENINKRVSELHNIKIDFHAVKKVIDVDYSNPSRFGDRPNLTSDHIEMIERVSDFKELDQKNTVNLMESWTKFNLIQIFSASISFFMLLIIPFLNSCKVSPLFFIVLASLCGLPIFLDTYAVNTKIRKTDALRYDMTKFVISLDLYLTDVSKDIRQKCAELEDLRKIIIEKNLDEPELRSNAILHFFKMSQKRKSHVSI